MKRTLIDVLRKGNQELFHSSMISWLLDPKAEHGFGEDFLLKFAEVLEEQGDPSLREALSYGELNIETEVTYHKSRYDILIETQDSRFIFENKTKSVGDLSQLRPYLQLEQDNDKKSHVYGLGFCDVSFPEAVYEEFKVITYTNILEILENLNYESKNDFVSLSKHYRDFLRRELGYLELITEYYFDGSLPHDDAIVETVNSIAGYTENDERFLNFYYLEKLRKRMCSLGVFKNSKWTTDKNMKSGVWLANRELPEEYMFHNEISQLCERMEAGMWFHVELSDGVLAESPSGKAGVLQLRCETEGSNKEFQSELRTILVLKNDECFSSSASEKDETFYVVRIELTKQDLVFQNMAKKLREFMELFGRFSGE